MTVEHCNRCGKKTMCSAYSRPHGGYICGDCATYLTNLEIGVAMNTVDFWMKGDSYAL